MDIEIRLFANLAKFLPPGSVNKRARISVEDGITVESLMNKLGIPINTNNIVMINGFHKDIKEKINEGDIVSIIPPVSGG